MHKRVLSMNESLGMIDPEMKPSVLCKFRLWTFELNIAWVTVTQNDCSHFNMFPKEIRKCLMLLILNIVNDWDLSFSTNHAHDPSEFLWESTQMTPSLSTNFWLIYFNRAWKVQEWEYFSFYIGATSFTKDSVVDTYPISTQLIPDRGWNTTDPHLQSRIKYFYIHVLQRCIWSYAFSALALHALPWNANAKHLTPSTALNNSHWH